MRRDVVVIAALSFVGIGALAAAWPLVKSLAPNNASEVPHVDVDLAGLEPRTFKSVSFEGKPLWVRRWSAQSPWIVTSGICSRCGCRLKLFEVPTEALVCPCCNSRYDFAGKRTVASGFPDLETFDHKPLSATLLRIGG